MTMTDNEDYSMNKDVEEHKEMYQALADTSLDEKEAEEEGLFDGQYAAANDQVVEEED